MNKEQGSVIDSLEVWLSKKPYWEQYIWKLNLEKDVLTPEDLNTCFLYLQEYLDLIPALPPKPAISFNAVIGETGEAIRPIRLTEIKSFKHVNALPEACSIKIGPNLTLVYGSNGSGKSGVGRLLCNSCFSRGERDILPNVKNPPPAGSVPEARFVLNDGAEIHYRLGEKYETLQRFSVFDAESILIHLDESNNISFTPAQVKVFDKVAETITDVEDALRLATFARLKPNPLPGIFLIEGETSPTSEFCKAISSLTKDEDFLKHANFDLKEDESKIQDLQKQIEEKKKLDIPTKRAQLASDRQSLEALYGQLETVQGLFATEKIETITKLLSDIREKQKIISASGVESFDDGAIATVGSAQWKSLISAAKILYEAEKVAREGKEPTHCMLCHQKLTEEAAALFQRYWQFLQSKAESELRQLYRQHEEVLEEFRNAKSAYPKFLETDSGVKVLKEAQPEYVTALKGEFASLLELLNSWMSKLKKFEDVAKGDFPDVNLEIIKTTIDAKKTAASQLVDPSAEIVKLITQLTALKHKKAVTAVKDSALEYLAFLRWKRQTDVLSFAGLRMSTTKKRTEIFLQGVAKKYKDVFNGELANLACAFNLVMLTSGEQGNTVKEYRLDFAKDYSPSEVLSQGEQNVCSLADFLTEIQLDSNNCGIIFDDPVTSLDHERKERIAQRLVLEAKRRQVVILTHDMVFMSLMAKHADRNNVPLVTHWMKNVAGVPGFVEDNTSPKLSSLSSSKGDAQKALKNYDGLGPKEQERALAVACDYLRSACEASIEELLFAEAVQRYDDQVRVQNLEEVVYDQASGLKIVELHGRISEMLLAHNRSDLKRENLPNLDDFNRVWKEFEDLEKNLKDQRKLAVKARNARKEARTEATGGW